MEPLTWSYICGRYWLEGDLMPEGFKARRSDRGFLVRGPAAVEVADVEFVVGVPAARTYRTMTKTAVQSTRRWVCRRRQASQAEGQRPDKAAVVDKLRELHRAVDTGIVPKTDYAHYTCGRRAVGWLAHGLEGGSAKTIKKNQNVLEPILKVAGARRLRELSAADVRQPTWRFPAGFLGAGHQIAGPRDFLCGSYKSRLAWPRRHRHPGIPASGCCHGTELA
jgi:hypothetical protein